MANASASASCPEVYCPEYYSHAWVMPLIVYVGSGVSLLSLLENALIFYALVQQRRRTDSYFLYLLLWALFDMLLSVCYVPVIVIDQARDRYQFSWLSSVWRVYFLPALVLCNVAMTASAYLIVGMQFERYLITFRSQRPLAAVRRYRKTICLLAIAVAAFLKGGMYFELTIVEERSCGGLLGLNVGPTALANNQFYVDLTFWTRSICCIYMPFGALTFFNAKILFRLKLLNRRAKLFNQAVDLRKQQARSATRTFVLIVCTYLVSNILNVVVTFWEHVDMPSIHIYHCQFHLIATDLVSLLTIVGCALRLPIYLVSNAELRQLMSGPAALQLIFSSVGVPVSEAARSSTCTSFGLAIADDGGPNLLHRQSRDEGSGIQLTGFIEQLAAAMVQSDRHSLQSEFVSSNGKHYLVHTGRTQSNKRISVKVLPTKLRVRNDSRDEAVPAGDSFILAPPPPPCSRRLLTQQTTALIDIPTVAFSRADATAGYVDSIRQSLTTAGKQQQPSGTGEQPDTDVIIFFNQQLQETFL